MNQELEYNMFVILFSQHLKWQFSTLSMYLSSTKITYIACNNETCIKQKHKV